MEKTKLLLVVELILLNISLLLFDACPVVAGEVMREQGKEQSNPYKEEANKKALEAKAMVAQMTEDLKNRSYAPCNKKQGNKIEGNGCVYQKMAIPKMPFAGSSQSQTVLVFVSFSMPEESLKGLSESLEQNPDVRLILRGLIEDSFEKTARRLHELKGVMEIDPELFETYQIEQVPTFVLVREGKPIAKLTGNISIPYAKELFADRGVS
jgi:conjugal transfer pilus assembly protein TrbC